MSKKFVWDDSFSVANAKIDMQHKKLFDIANSIVTNQSQQQIKSVIIDLYKYIREHFVAEEQMMHSISYPKLKEHKKQHKELISDLNTMSTQSFDDKESVTNFVTFVYYWLTHHILYQDMDYMRFAQDQAIENYDS